MKKLLLLLIPLLFISCDFNKENNETQQPSTTQPTTQQPATTQPTTQQPATDQTATPPAEQPTTPPEETTTPVTDPTTPQTNPTTEQPTTPSEEQLEGTGFEYEIRFGECFDDDFSGTATYSDDNKNCSIEFLNGIALLIEQCAIYRKAHYIFLKNHESVLSILNVPPSNKKREIKVEFSFATRKDSAGLDFISYDKDFNAIVEENIDIPDFPSNSYFSLSLIVPPKTSNYIIRLDNKTNTGVRIHNIYIRDWQTEE